MGAHGTPGPCASTRMEAPPAGRALVPSPPLLPAPCGRAIPAAGPSIIGEAPFQPLRTPARPSRAEERRPPYVIVVRLTLALASGLLLAAVIGALA